MPNPLLHPLLQTVQPGFIILTVVTIMLVFMLIVLVESVVFQLLGWGDLKEVWIASLKVNAVSGILTAPLLAMARQWGEPSLWLACALSILIEVLILQRLKRGAWLQNALCALLANSASFFILILPSFRFA